MHPAPSIILFTTLSGLGFGLLTFLGLNMPDVDGWVLFTFFFVGFALSVGGLLSSTFHLGHPERAWRALSQWKSSWLSREGICAVAALCVLGLYALLAIFFDTKVAALGFVGSALSLLTVFTTSMIYTQMKTVPRWNHWSTPLLFLSLSIGGGALLAAQTAVAGLFLLIATLTQAFAFWGGDRRFKDRGHSLKTATGLQNGELRLFEPPHTGTNYLLKEMVHQIGRKHAQRLRVLGLVFGLALPTVLLLSQTVGHVLAGLIVVLHVGGVLALRWLFFAEAEHVVGLYYGKHG
ncbi:MAG: dimethyl sulfoxide reductase anchor subunit [Dinoroseobacter sp.]|nr:dimethyl sulfoxide reductase anchor subunit [Dinoroseobacter sp.]